MVALGLGFFWVERKTKGERDKKREGGRLEAGGLGFGSRIWGYVRLIS